MKIDICKHCGKPIVSYISGYWAHKKRNTEKFLCTQDEGNPAEGTIVITTEERL